MVAVCLLLVQVRLPLVCPRLDKKLEQQGLGHSLEIKAGDWIWQPDFIFSKLNDFLDRKSRLSILPVGFNKFINNWMSLLLVALQWLFHRTTSFDFCDACS